MDSKLGKIHASDCVKGMNGLPEGGIDLAFADPPFNIGYQYDVYEDRLAADDYLRWSNEWMTAVYRVLKDDGTFWLAIGDDFAAELKIEARKIGFHCRSWVIWYYTFGVNCTNKFTRSHTHLFHFVKDPEQFTFRADDLANRVPSARMLVYNDKRARGNGRLPDDTWIIPPVDGETVDAWLATDSEEALSPTFALRPQELEARFEASEDTWYIPRVAGTFKERAGFHGCQMPEQLLGRIIRTCSNENDIVLDPFSGSASTLITAKKLGRRFLGFEMSKDYVSAGRSRLKETQVGDPLDGTTEPTMEAFQRSETAKKSRRRTSSGDFTSEAASEVSSEHWKKVRNDLESGVIASFAATHNGFSTDVVLADPERNAAFTNECTRLGLPGAARVWNRLLFAIRKRTGNKLPPTTKRFSLPFSECEKFLFASEIAWKTLIDDERAGSLDDILCDPFLAQEFDQVAGWFAPGFSNLQYRWGALRIRKDASNARASAAVFQTAVPRKLGKTLTPDGDHLNRLPTDAGVYIVSGRDSERVYIGGTTSLRTGIQGLTRLFEFMSMESGEIGLQFHRTGDSPRELLGWTSCFVSNAVDLPRFNVPDLRTQT